MTADAETPTAGASPDERRRKRLVLLIILAAWALNGILDALFAEMASFEKYSELFAVVCFAFCTRLWCHYDSQERGFSIGRFLSLSIVLIALIGFPVYAFRTRGLAGFRLVGGAVLFMLAVIMFYGLARVATECVAGFAVG